MERLTDEQSGLAGDNVWLAVWAANKRLHAIEILGFDEVHSLARLGLCQAARTFDGRAGGQFSTLAVRCMNNEINNAMRTHYRSCRWGRHPDGRPVNTYDVVDIDPIARADERVGRAEGMEWLATLPSIERHVLTLLLGGLTVKEVAVRLGRTKQRIYQIKAQALARL